MDSRGRGRRGGKETGEASQGSDCNTARQKGDSVMDRPRWRIQCFGDRPEISIRGELGVEVDLLRRC